MIQIFEPKDYSIQTEDYKAADRIVSEFEEQLFQKYKPQPFNYPISSYGLYWKWMNRLDGFC
jgi:hypothetical protein